MNEPVKPVENRQAFGKFGPHNNANPNGRPKKQHSLTDALTQILTEQPEIKKALITKTLKLALESGDMEAIKLLWDRVDGKAIQMTELSLRNNQPFLVLGDANGTTTTFRVEGSSEPGTTDELPEETKPGPDNPPEPAV